MKSKSYISLNAAVKLIIYTVVSTLMIALSFYVLDDIADNGGDWLNTTITAVGNFSGGIIGGVVAYVVASYQVRQSSLIQEKTSQRENFTILRLLKEEISYNKEVLSVSLTNYQEAKSSVNEYLAKHLQLNQWVTLSSKIGTEVTDNHFLHLCDFYRKINFMKTSDKLTTEVFIRTADELASTLLNELQIYIDSIKNKITEK